MNVRFQGFAWLLRSSAWILAGSVVGQFVGICATLLLTRAIGLELFGLFSLIIALVTLSSGIVTNALSRAQARFTSHYLGQGDSGSIMGSLYLGVGASCICSLLPTSLILMWSDELSWDYLNDDSLEPLIWVAAVIIPCLSVKGTCLQALRGLGYVADRVFLESVLRPTLRCAFYIVLAASLTLPFAVYLEVGISLLLVSIALVLLFMRSRPFHGARSVYQVRDFVGFSLPLLPAMAAAQLTYQLPMLSLGWFGMVKQVAIFAVCLRIAAFGRTLVMSINSNFAPMISLYDGGGREDELVDLFRKVSRCLLIITSLWVAGCIVFGHDVLLLFGGEFTQGYYCLVILSALTLPIGIFGPVSNVITMTGHTNITMVNNLLMLALTACLILLWGPVYGADGVAGAVVCSALLYQAYQAFCLYRLRQMVGFTARGLFFSVVIAATACAITYFRELMLQDLHLWIQLASSFSFLMLSFFVCLFLFTSRSERGFFLRLITSRLPTQNQVVP